MYEYVNLREENALGALIFTGSSRTKIFICQSSWIGNITPVSCNI